jgi:hypothetical protein
MLGTALITTIAILTSILLAAFKDYPVVVLARAISTAIGLVGIWVLTGVL